MYAQLCRQNPLVLMSPNNNSVENKLNYSIEVNSTSFTLSLLRKSKVPIQNSIHLHGRKDSETNPLNSR